MKETKTYVVNKIEGVAWFIDKKEAQDFAHKLRLKNPFAVFKTREQKTVISK